MATTEGLSDLVSHPGPLRAAKDIANAMLMGRLTDERAKKLVGHCSQRAQDGTVRVDLDKYAAVLAAIDDDTVRATVKALADPYVTA